MKKIKKSTWIAILCVISAITASQIYGTVGTEKAETDSVTKVSEMTTEVSETPKPEKPAPIRNLTPEEPIIKQTEKKEMNESNTIETPEVSRAVSSPDVITDAPEETVVFSLPSTGEVGTKYSEHDLVYFGPLKEWRCHLGVDFLPADSDAVFAAANGKVEKIYEDHLYGTTILIAHGEGFKTYYGSLSEVSVKEGDNVKSGQEIAKMGQTAAAEEGVHLHFTMEKNGTYIDPLGENR